MLNEKIKIVKAQYEQIIASNISLIKQYKIKISAYEKLNPESMPIISASISPTPIRKHNECSQSCLS